MYKVEYYKVVLISFFLRIKKRKLHFKMLHIFLAEIDLNIGFFIKESGTLLAK